jgi:hypothetical protein
MSKFLYQIQSGLNHQHTYGLIDYWVQTLTGSGYTQTSQIQVEATGSITKIGVLFSSRTGTPGVFRISLEDPATPGVYLNSGTAYADYNSGTGTIDTFAELTIPACPVVLGQYINVVTQTYSGTFDASNKINHLYALSAGGFHFPNGNQFFRTPCFYYVINGKYYGYPNYKEVSTTVTGTQEAGIKITIPKGAGTTHLLQDIVSKLNGNSPLSILIYASNGTTLLHQSDVIFGSNSWRVNKFPLSSEFYMKSGETYYIVFKAPSGGTLYFAVVDGYNEQSWESQSQEYMIYVNRASSSVAFTETAGRRMSAQLRFKDLVSLDYYAPTSTFNKAINIKAGTTSYSEYVQLNTTGLSFSTPGISASYVRSGAARVGISLVSQTVSGVWTSGGFVEVDAVNMPGLYRIDVPDSALASGVNQVTLMIKGYNNTNGALVTYQFTQELMQVDMTQVYPNFNTSGTVGDALNAARSGVFGKRILSGRNINYYAPDEITITKSLELDSASAPLVRQENVEQNASITNSGLVFYLDAANSLSYPGTGTTWYDLSGRGNHANLGNGTVWVNAGVKSYMSFDGVDDFLSFVYDNSLFTNEATVIAWMQVYYPLAGYGFFDIGRPDNYYPYANGNIYFGTFANYRVFEGEPNAFNKNENHMVAITTKPGTNNYKLYQNAVLTHYKTPNTNSFTVSTYKGFSLDQKFKGKLFHVLLYNRALTDAEITSTFNSLKSRYISTAPQYIPANGLMMYLDAADPVSYSGAGNIWYDISGNGFDATLLNGTTYVNNGTAKHFYLDPANDRINFSITSASFGSSATVIFWTQKDTTSINTGFIDINNGSDSWYTYGGAAYIATFKNTRINNGQAVTTFPISVTSNHMVTVTNTSGANGYSIYQNDTLVWNETGGSVNINNSGFGIVHPFGGKVYAVMIYNRVLSANEISTIYNSMKSRYGL